MRRTQRTPAFGFFSLVLALGLAPACGDSSTDTAAPTPPAPTPTELAPAPEVEVTASGPRDGDESFTLEARPDEGGYTVGGLARFGLHIEGRDGWHLNHEFPVSVALRAPDGVQLPKQTLEKSDAAEFVDERARFDVPFTPTAAGSHEVTAVVSFAMCNPSSCIPKTSAVALALVVP